MADAVISSDRAGWFCHALCAVCGCIAALDFYSELNLNQYSVGSPCRTICTVCGSPPCPDLNL
ncbi:MAG: hypothetical protein E7I45_08110, partial [Eikenella corrodens]|uniref:hypothetical protein n=1 Tax=Eikenella corrodens TaxID=539 RepID=UPI00290C44CE